MYWGFEIRIEAREGAMLDEDILDDFVEFIEQNDLQYGGVCDHGELSGIVQVGSSQDLAKEKRLLIAKWFWGRIEVSYVRFSCVYDINRIDGPPPLDRSEIRND